MTGLTVFILAICFSIVYSKQNNLHNGLTSSARKKYDRYSIEEIQARDKEAKYNRINNTLNDEFCVRKDPSSKIFSSQSWIHAGLKSTVKIECRVCGVADNCMYTVHWRKDGNLLSNFPSLRIHSFTSYSEKHLYSLEIKNIRMKDYGVYSCVYNTTQGDNHTAITEISGIPYPAIWDSNTSTDKTATLSWKVNCSTYIINYQLEFRESLSSEWIMFNIPAIYSNMDEINYRQPLFPIDSIHYQNYTIKGLKQDTTYQTRIKSRNLFGISKSSKIFKFRTKPSRLRSYLKTKKKSNEIQNDQQIPRSKLTTTKQGFYVSNHSASSILLTYPAQSIMNIVFLLITKNAII